MIYYMKPLIHLMGGNVVVMMMMRTDIGGWSRAGCTYLVQTWVGSQNTPEVERTYFMDGPKYNYF